MGVCAEKTIVFFYAYTAGRFYWLLFAIVIHALLNIHLGGFFNDATVCICCEGATKGPRVLKA